MSGSSTLKATVFSQEIAVAVVMLTTLPRLSLTDTLSLADSMAKSLSTATADTVALADSGSVTAQSYADPTCFAGDYVGGFTTL